ncbi:MAG: hypothetical protein JO244_11645 [Solirubrobacterales bacterium]|nr:hypothetical protein [Solirubrobacterales bacterium]
MSSVRSAARGTAVLAVLAGLSGCVTTMQKNARTLLLNQRTLASETGFRVGRENPSIAVLGVSVVRARDEAALAVRLANTSPRPLTDLPISVGIRTPAGRRLYLNAAAGGAYYDAHVAAIGPRAVATWVYTLPALPHTAGRPFALVGQPHLPPSTTAGRLPAVGATVRALAGGGDRVSVENRSGIPQYDLQVYAVDLAGSRVVGAARGSITELDPGARTTLRLRLVGGTPGTPVQVYVLPTIFA